MAEVVNFAFLVLSAAMMIAVTIATDNPQHDQQDMVGCTDKQSYTYVNATAFQENLDSVLAYLVSNISGGYAYRYEDKAGITDPVFGVAVCRKYLSTGECSECITEAAKLIKAQCLQSIGGRIHLDGCFLRYKNTTSFERKPVDNGAAHYCFSTNDSGPQTSSQRAETLSAQLISDAAANNNYAVGRSIDGSLYGLAQCWPNMLGSGSETFTRMYSPARRSRSRSGLFYALLNLRVFLR